MVVLINFILRKVVASGWLDSVYGGIVVLINILTCVDFINVIMNRDFRGRRMYIGFRVWG